MKVTVEAQKIQEILDLVSRFVSKHATLPILENVYIKGSIDTLLFRATDMEKYIEVEIPAQIENEGSLTVNAKTFSDIVRTIDEEHLTLQIDVAKDTLQIHSASDEFSIRWIPATEYVAVPAVQSDSTVIMQTEDFSKGISKVEYAVTEKNFSPVLTGVLMRIKEYDGKPHLVFVGTDSFRLAEYKIPYMWGSGTPFSMIIPKVHINDIKKVADYAKEKEWEQIVTKFSENMVSFSFNLSGMKVECMCLLIQWSFPEYENENIMPTAYTTKVLTDAMQFDKAIKKIGILTRDINNFISVQTSTEKLHITSGETDLWVWETTLTALVEWEEAQFGMNGKYIADFLRSVQSEEVVMQITTAEKPVIFKDKEDSYFTYVVRPLIK